MAALAERGAGMGASSTAAIHKQRIKQHIVVGTFGTSAVDVHGEVVSIWVHIAAEPAMCDMDHQHCNTALVSLLLPLSAYHACLLFL